MSPHLPRERFGTAYRGKPLAKALSPVIHAHLPITSTAWSQQSTQCGNIIRDGTTLSISITLVRIAGYGSADIRYAIALSAGDLAAPGS
jgi:hypothetical protein